MRFKGKALELRESFGIPVFMERQCLVHCMIYHSRQIAELGFTALYLLPSNSGRVHSATNSCLIPCELLYFTPAFKYLQLKRTITSIRGPPGPNNRDRWRVFFHRGIIRIFIIHVPCLVSFFNRTGPLLVPSILISSRTSRVSFENSERRAFAFEIDVNSLVLNGKYLYKDCCGAFIWNFYSRRYKNLFAFIYLVRDFYLRPRFYCSEPVKNSHFLLSNDGITFSSSRKRRFLLKNTTIDRVCPSVHPSVYQSVHLLYKLSKMIINVYN